MSNSDNEIIRLLESYADANYHKNKYTRAESKAKAEFLAFIEDNNGEAVVTSDLYTKRYSYGDIVSYEDVIDPKTLFDYLVSLGMEDEFWGAIVPVKSRLANILSPAQIARISTTTKTIKKGIKELR